MSGWNLITESQDSPVIQAKYTDHEVWILSVAMFTVSAVTVCRYQSWRSFTLSFCMPSLECS